MERTPMLEFCLGMYISHQMNAVFFKKKKDPNINLKRVNVCSLVLEQ